MKYERVNRLRLYFDECQKNEIHLYFHFISLLIHHWGPLYVKFYYKSCKLRG